MNIEVTFTFSDPLLVFLIHSEHTEKLFMLNERGFLYYSDLFFIGLELALHLLNTYTKDLEC